MSQARRFVEQRIQKNRDAEAKTASVRKMLAEQNIIGGHGRSDRRVETLRRDRHDREERRELWTDRTHLQREMELERRNFMAEAEDRLAAELAARSAERERKDQRRRLICEGSEELRSLKGRLFAAEVNKQRSMQLLEQQLRLEHDKNREQMIAAHMETERLENQEMERKLDVEKHHQRMAVKSMNQEQIALNQALRAEAELEHQKEKAQVQEIVDKITQEDVAELTARRAKQKENFAMLMQFNAEEAARRAERKRLEQEENDRIEAYAKKKRDDEDRLAAEQAALDQEKKRRQAQLCSDAEARSREIEALEQLRNDLHQEELEAGHRKRELQQKQRREDAKQEMKAAFSYQMQLKQEKADMQKIEEEHFREKLMAKYAEDDRIEQLNDRARRAKLDQHKREVERLIQERKTMHEAEREAELEEARQAKADEEERQMVVEDERRRLLAEHAMQLKDFLPKGTLECSRDYEIIYGHHKSGALTAR